jgi:hypothetical protein
MVLFVRDTFFGLCRDECEVDATLEVVFAVVVAVVVELKLKSISLWTRRRAVTRRIFGTKITTFHHKNQQSFQ